MKRTRGKDKKPRGPYGAAKKFLTQFLLRRRFSKDCITWSFGCTTLGRPQIEWDGKMQYVCRIICTEFYGDPPTDEHEAAHSCGNGHIACINPRHLRWKTHAENCAESWRAGTWLKTARRDRLGRPIAT